MENCQYEHQFFIIIESDSHDTCRRFTVLMKNAIDPWFFQVDLIKEIKSARKGDVLKRSIQVRHIAYSPDIITFNEMLRTLIWHYNLRFKVNIRIDDRGTTPKDSRVNLVS